MDVLARNENRVRIGRGKVGIHNENSHLAAKTHNAAKSLVSEGIKRSALGEINNRVQNIQIDAQKQVIKKEIKKEKPLTRSNATTSLKHVASIKPKLPAAIKLEKVEKAPNKFQAPAIASPKVGFSSNQMVNVKDIDREDADNPQLLSEYVNDIYQYMRELEVRYSIRPEYLSTGDQEITGKMRAILIDWLVQVHLRFHLLQETLYLTVAILDRYLQDVKVPKKKLQLVGVTAMLIASKYEEMFAPEVGDFEYITDNAYTTAEIRKQECEMLKQLGFNLGKPLPLHFLRRNSKAGAVDPDTHQLAKYLMEMTITEYNMVHYKPSEVAAAALALSMRVLDNGEWSATLQHYSTYKESELEPIMRQMATLVRKSDSAKLSAIRDKYKSSKFARVSTFPELLGSVIKKYSTV